MSQIVDRYSRLTEIERKVLRAFNNVKGACNDFIESAVESAGFINGETEIQVIATRRESNFLGVPPTTKHIPTTKMVGGLK